MSSRVISAQIETFQQQGDIYTKKIEIEKRRITELDDKLKSSKARLSEARRSMGGVNEAQNQMRKKQRQMRVLENQLEKAIVRLNQATAFNDKKRREIEDLRREKLQRDGIEKSQLAKLDQKKVELVEIIEQSQKAMEARDLARAQIVALKKRIGHEVQKFEVEWSDRMSALENDRKLYNEHVKDTRLKMEKDSHQGKLTVAQEASIKAKSTKAYWNIAKREIDLEKQAEKIMTYKDAFAKIKKATGIESIAQMVEEFVRSEDQNFALFNQINNVHREIETLEVDNSKMRNQVEKFKLQGNSSEMNKNKIFTNLQSQIERAEKSQIVFKERYDEAIDVIGQLKPSLLSLFREAGCDQGSGALGTSLLSQGPTDANLLQFLGVIEQRVQEMAQLHKLKHGISMQGGITTNSAPPTPMSKRRHRPGYRPRLPGTGEMDGESDDDDDDGTSLKPIAIADFRKKAKMKFQTKQQDDHQMGIGSL